MKKYIVLVCVLHTALTLCAWSGSGHMTAGAVAYYHLKAHKPEVLTKILTSLKLHPWYSADKWTDKMAGMTNEEKDIALFMLASTFPDEARSIPDLGGGEKTKWHYVDYPYAIGNINAENPQSPNAEEKIIELITTLKTESEGPKKAIDLCWLFHLIEDVHQPLHTVSLFDVNHQKGDRGGNDTYIQFDSSNAPIKLHSYWDNLVKGTIKSIPELAQKLVETEGTLTKEEQSDSLPHQWIWNESFQLAIKGAYRNGEIVGTKDHPTQVDKSYSDSSKKTATRRVYVSGIRLAALLITIYGT